MVMQVDSTHTDRLPDFTKLWDFANPAETECRFRAIVPRAKLSHDAEYLAQLLTQIARCLIILARATYPQKSTTWQGKAFTGSRSYRKRVMARPICTRSRMKPRRFG